MKLKMKTTMIPLLLAGLGAGLFGSARAGVVWYTDRSVWNAAAGAVSFTENFSGFTTDQQFRSASVGLNGMTISQEGTNVTNFRNTVDALPFDFLDNNGTAHVSAFTDFGATTVRISFAALSSAFGGETWGAASGEVAELVVFDGSTELGSRSLTNGSGDFLGYVLTGGSTASSVLFRSVNNFNSTFGEGFGIDNLAGVDANAVPEPGALALVGLGLAVVGATRRRRA